MVKQAIKSILVRFRAGPASNLVFSRVFRKTGPLIGRGVYAEFYNEHDKTDLTVMQLAGWHHGKWVSYGFGRW